MSEEEITKYQGNQVAVVQPMTVAEIKNRMGLLQDVMKDVMQQGDGKDYGTIEGCGDNLTLFEAGAEKLMCMFRLYPKLEEKEKDLPDGHREYLVKCSLYAHDGTFAGEAIGCASTMESKYRFRSEGTGQEVPKEYWNNRNPDLLGGSQYSPKKVKDNYGRTSWIIFHKVEHDNPADYYNTTLKIAQKRAKVAAAKTATGASFLFSQESEDKDTHVPDNDDAANTSDHRYKPDDRPETPAQQQTASKDFTITKPQQSRLWAIARENNIPDQKVKDGLKHIFNIERTEDIERRDYDKIINWVEDGCKAEFNFD